MNSCSDQLKLGQVCKFGVEFDKNTIWFTKNDGSKKVFRRKNFGSKIILDPKIFLVQKDSGVQNNFRPKRKLGPKKFWIKKVYGPKPKGI